MICDNLSAHKAPAVHRWLLAHPRVQLHFTPTYSSWISQVERWFAELQRRCLDRGVFCSLDELATALEEWIKIWNASARPFRWTKTGSVSHLVMVTTGGLLRHAIPRTASCMTRYCLQHRGCGPIQHKIKRYLHVI